MISSPIPSHRGWPDGERIIFILRSSPFHMWALEAVRTLDLPDCWIAAGFVRNLVWDYLHKHEAMTPLNDIDVVYYDPDDLNETTEKHHEEHLHKILPGLPWSVKNQARMHLKNGDAQYRSTAHALAHWLETVTPIGARLENNEDISIIAPLGIDDLLGLRCHATPYAHEKPGKLVEYHQRMLAKKWWKIWPQVQVGDLSPA